MNQTQLLAACRKLPHVTEDIKWKKDLVFSVGGKMFACFSTEVLDEVSFKTTPTEFQELTRQPGILPAPYAARFHWVFVTAAAKMPTTAAAALIKRSYELVAECLPARLRASLHNSAPSPKRAAPRTARRKSTAKARSSSRK